MVVAFDARDRNHVDRNGFCGSRAKRAPGQRPKLCKGQLPSPRQPPAAAATRSRVLLYVCVYCVLNIYIYIYIYYVCSYIVYTYITTRDTRTDFQFDPLRNSPFVFELITSPFYPLSRRLARGLKPSSPKLLR